MRRMRRLRKPGLRRMVAETKVSVDDLIMPLFVDERLKRPIKIESMPGQNRHSLESRRRRSRSWRSWGSLR